MKGYFVFIVNSASEAAGGRVAMISATTPESGAALRERMGSVKQRMRGLDVCKETERKTNGKSF